MKDYMDYDGNPPKRRKAFIIISLIIVALATVGVLIVQYVIPQPEDLMSELIVEATPMVTPVATEVITEDIPIVENTIITTEIIEKTVTYVESGSIPDIVEIVSPSIVGIINYTETTEYNSFGQSGTTSEVPQSTGSGVIISEDGYIVTNNHVIEDATRITVTLTNGREYNAEIIGSDRYVDLGVLKIDATGLNFLKFGDSEAARAGELAIAIGYPLSDDFSAITVTAGILSAVGRNVEVNGINFEMLQTDAPINPGNSGGALIDGSGQLIGINTLKTIYAGYTEYGGTISAEGIGFAIPSHVVKPIVEQLINDGEIIRPFMGVAGRIISEADAIYYDIPQGLYIDELSKDGPSEKAGILVGDIITHADNTQIVLFQDLFTALNSHEVGDEITFTVYREDTEETLEIIVVLASSKDYNN